MKQTNTDSFLFSNQGLYRAFKPSATGNANYARQFVPCTFYSLQIAVNSVVMEIKSSTKLYEIT